MIKKFKYKYFILLISFLLYISFFLIKICPNKNISNSLAPYQKIYSKTISYKGEKVLKSKLLDDYLSKISDDYSAEKIVETNLFNQYYYLANYYEEPLIKSELKSKFLQYISELKKQVITKIDIFYLSYNINFGNNLLVVNNAIFFCEIIGCHEIILNKNKVKRRWLIIKPVYDKKSNITNNLFNQRNYSNK